MFRPVGSRSRPLTVRVARALNTSAIPRPPTRTSKDAQPPSPIQTPWSTSTSTGASVQRRAQDRIESIEARRGVSPFLVDGFQREHNYLRISLTERCNLRCFYCMPSEGIELSPPEHLLSDDEIIRLATLFVTSGVTKIRLTGGEPTVRKGIVEIVGRLNLLHEHGLQSIGMTSNGIALHRKLPALVRNGLTHLNISLDTLDPFKFEIMTRRRGHDAVLRSLTEALATPELQSVKLNVVVVKGLNDHEVPEFIEMTRDSRLSVRFIEFMPFTGNRWDKAKMVPSADLLARVRERYPTLRKGSDELNDTARSYIIPGYQGSFGFISSMSDHFCGSCNRLRLTADGQIKVCLFDAKEISLRDQMRAGVDDEGLLTTIGRAVLGKKAKHAGMEDIDVVTNRPMILIGGSHRPVVRRSTTPLSPKARSALQLPPSAHRPTRTNSGTAARCFSTSSRSLAPKNVAPDPSHLRLTHIDATGRPSMVDVAHKAPTSRTATASGRIVVPRAAYALVVERGPRRAHERARGKGDVLTVAQLAAIMGCKRTAELIPLCHPLALSHVAVGLHAEVRRRVGGGGCGDRAEGAGTSIVCRATVSCEGKTGVEMEALTAVSVGLLTVWDMLKAVAGREMVIRDVLVERKAGGKSGDFALASWQIPGERTHFANIVSNFFVPAAQPPRVRVRRKRHVLCVRTEYES
ncbi:molybdenum cofactor biosynthesis prote [Epithele typhae]|uniref:molybdenum cofactor biosynthesis prote n=1 Tax=Epithele typhae TaxID=378194 RepID=UPI0020084C26|nr:molybdenum cofactor biosynthesis prote [Epithele typhae]KAH9920240.1 molybdenum cofactor biosynthesis prote [Epithele typhae]